MVFISKAWAQETPEMADAAVAAAEVSPWAGVASQFMLIMVLVALFYILLIAPQKKRFKEHKDMLDALKKGDKVVTAGGLVGKIEKLDSDDEVTVDLGNGTKVKALRSTIQQKVEKK